MDIKEIKKALQTTCTRFTIAGITESSIRPDLQEFEILEYTPGSFAMNTRGLFISGMNIKKWGTKRFYVFDYTILGKKVSDSINYSDITIIQVGNPEEQETF